MISRFGRPSAVKLSLRIGGKALDVRRTGAAAGAFGFGGAEDGADGGAEGVAGFGGCGVYC